MKFKSIVIFIGVVLFSQNVKAMDPDQKEERSLVTVRRDYPDSDTKNPDKGCISLWTGKYYVSLWPGEKNSNNELALCVDGRDTASHVIAVDYVTNKQLAEKRGLTCSSELYLPLYAKKIDKYVESFMSKATDFTEPKTSTQGKLILDVEWKEMGEIGFTDALFIRKLLYEGGIHTFHEDYNLSKEIVQDYVSLEKKLLDQLELKMKTSPQEVYELCQSGQDTSCKSSALALFARGEQPWLQPHRLKEAFNILFKTPEGESYKSNFTNYLSELKETYESDTSYWGYVNPMAWKRYVTGEWESKK